jgi:hypothetical protein
MMKEQIERSAQEIVIISIITVVIIAVAIAKRPLWSGASDTNYR